MSPTKIEKLTPEQEALIPVYREKWKAIALSTEPIDHQKASLAVKAVYAAIGLSEPEVLFFDNPFSASYTAVYTPLSYLYNQLRNQPEELPCDLWLSLGSRLEWDLCLQLESQLKYDLWCQLASQLGLGGRGGWIVPPLSQLWGQLERLLMLELEKIESQLWFQLESNLGSHLRNHLRGQRRKLPIYKLHSMLRSHLSRQLRSLLGSLIFDFCISVLNCAHDHRQWSLLQLLVSSCGWWIFPLKKTCFICDRPRQLRFDRQQRLHAEGEPAIQFADGYSSYFYHGVTLPEKYGKLHPIEWQAQWLLEEKNAELRRVLIQGIGYTRICQELQAIQLDSHQEYSLLRIDQFIELDREPIYLLKMTCSSTGKIHALRVPPDIQSAKEAICWVNWGIAPEDFAVQT